MTLSLRYAARSHVGLIRDGNEDSGYAGPRLLVVADGMGGQAAGELASSVVVQTMAQLDTMFQSRQHGDPVRALSEKVDEAHGRLNAIISQDPRLEGMGTTLTAFLFVEGHVAFAHIGDSRAYRLRGGLLEQLTNDHTWVQRLVDEGRISEQEAGHHPQRSLLMRALDGRGQAAEPDFSVTDVRAGDRFMLCSDGLSSFVSFDTLESALAGYADPHQSAETLIQLALRAGGPDNVTCIVADAVEGGAMEADPTNARTQVIELPVTVGAAAEHRGTGLPAFGAPQSPDTPAGSGPGSGADQAAAGFPGRQPPEPDDFPTDTPAGRAARLRHDRRTGRNSGEAGRTAEDDLAPDGDQAERENGSAFASHREDGRRWLKPTAITGVFVLVVGGILGGGYLWSRHQYYVADDNGTVAIYRGVDFSVFGLPLSQVYSTLPTITMSSLPAPSRSQVEATITASGLADAQAIVQTLATLSASCSALVQQSQLAVPATSGPATVVGAPPSGAAPSATATGTATGTGSGTTPGATTSPRPTQSAHPTATSASSAGNTGTGLLATQCPGVVAVAGQG